jgi:hypothetical protein|tara:strand:+ start:328 stop:585 length:258 start_codon:yes stop_codon:yes gene_type:complete
MKNKVMRNKIKYWLIRIFRGKNKSKDFAIDMQMKYMYNNKLKSELEWYRTYGEYINRNFPKVDSEACSFADGDEELFEDSSFGDD